MSSDLRSMTPEAGSDASYTDIFKELFADVSEEDVVSPEERLENLKKAVRESSPIGAELIDRAEKDGCAIVFDDNLKTPGIFIPSSNSIRLNPSISDDYLMSVLVHEARHWDQLNRAPDCVSEPALDLAGLINICRIREADAKAVQCLAAYQMKDKHPEAWEAFAENSLIIAERYEEKLKETNDPTQLLSAAFKGWFDSIDYANCYDQRTLSFAENRIRKNTGGIMEKKLSPEKVLHRVCRFNGAEYMTGEDARFLRTPQGSTLKKSTFARCAAAAEVAFDRGLSKKKDLSYVNFHVLTPSGIVKGESIRFKKPEAETKTAEAPQKDSSAAKDTKRDPYMALALAIVGKTGR